MFVKWVRTWVHRGSVITSLHCRVTWMYRVYWHRICVTLVRAHCVFAGFGSLSAPGGNAPSSKQPARRPLEKAFEEGSAGSSDRHQLRALTVLGPAPAALTPNEPPDEAAAGGLCCTTLGEKQAECARSWPALANLPPGTALGMHPLYFRF